ncbi:SRPBCC domain-containing protein [Ruegeria sp.]|uniref:SRPBCC domain-containing protein n=1 Tax=Ruegeria sp. TaxID=1879320 RepID=UPI00231307A7|nr:SRPBCC domain-containing protein [Ruegeria sp.]MDA7966885.1 SRPBCC domain-containing protein [Ruegeria sp.]
MTDPITKTVVVNAQPDRAFDVFVNRIAKWWPLDGHAVSAGRGKPALAVVIEPFVGGAVYETMFDGTRADWGRVQVFELAQRLAFSWHPGTDPDRATLVEIAFEPHGEGQTQVTLTHSGWEVWADDAPAKRGSYDSGWDHVLGECYAQAVGA